MKRLYAVVFIITIIAANFALCGFARAEEPAYFTIRCGDETIIVTESTLRGHWFNTESQSKFTNGKTLYERAARCDALTERDFPELWQITERIRRKTEVKAYDGLVNFAPGGEPRFWTSGARVGRDLDEQRLCRDILQVLKAGKHGEVTAHVRDVLPRSERETLSKIGLRGGYTTHYDDNPPRVHNIAKALAAFNGLVVQNGARVSFNKVVGARSAARGYEEAKIIINGEFVPGVGGGVCQASTTLFNALLLAGLKIEESHNHSLAVSYVPLGRDAMVSSASDLTFVNNSGGTIYIEAGTSGDRAYVKIYGNKTNIRYRPRIEWRELPLQEHETEPRRVADTYLDAVKGERVVNTKKIRKSWYLGKKELPQS